MSDRVFTIGHSNHSIGYFIDLLQQHLVTAIADVRSHPFSRHVPDFSQDCLKSSLKAVKIAYAFLGKELGARSDNKSCYLKGKVQYDLLAKESLFSSGLDRVRKGMQTHSIALMCSEKDPLECHRAILVARHLYASGIPVSHILASGRLVEHAELEKQMLAIHKLSERNLFDSPDEILEEAYMLQGERIAYTIDHAKQRSHELRVH